MLDSHAFFMFCSLILCCLYPILFYYHPIPSLLLFSYLTVLLPIASSLECSSFIPTFFFSFCCLISCPRPEF
ncbi:hypothetical protein XELAEV_18044037mg [Xenopus laevis]|uniref:Uncharacterized protein n=1 Tax=Xenopus laevis TaxID=8355 RepID=A0A974H2Y4_XENLA|nr:hypothetical protein XELAEV_18044037mg [Xenopus laevis]